MSEMDGNININEVLQIVRFGGDGLRVFLKGGFKGGKWMWNKKKLLTMKGRLALHYHSKALTRKGELRKGLSLHRLEKLTGGSYGVLNIPTEDKEELANFLKVLKKQRIAYSVLPDLIPGNGYTQIAYDPASQAKLDALVDIYSFDSENPQFEDKKAEVIDFEEYWNEGNVEEKEKIVSAAIDEAKKEQVEELKKNPEAVKKLSEDTKKDLKAMTKLEKIKMRHQSRDYYRVTIDEKMVVAESETSYVTRVPGSFNRNNGGYDLLIVDKENAIPTNGGKTILTHLKKDEETRLYDRNRKEKKVISNKDLYEKHYDKFHTEFDKRNGRNHTMQRNANGKTATLHTNRNIKK